MKKQIKNTLPVATNTSLVAARGVSDESGLAQYIQTVQKIPILTAEEEYEYATQWVKNHDAAAAEKLVAKRQHPRQHRWECRRCIQSGLRSSHH